MNRQQAAHILAAYTRMRMREADKDTADALREVILDAMTEYRNTGAWSGYGITVPNMKPLDLRPSIDVTYGTGTEAVEHD